MITAKASLGATVKAVMLDRRSLYQIILYGWMLELEPAVLVYKQHLVTNLGPVMKRFFTRETGALSMMVGSSVLFVQVFEGKVVKCD